MAGPLTKVKEIALFEALEIPYSFTGNRLIDPGMIAEVTSVVGSARAAKTLVLNHLTTDIYPDTDIFNVLDAYLANWIALGVDTSAIVNGAVGNIQGLTDDIQNERREIQRRIIIMVPFYRHHEQILIQNGAPGTGGAGAGGGIIPIVR
jgi:hypothetical protein